MFECAETRLQMEFGAGLYLDWDGRPKTEVNARRKNIEKVVRSAFAMESRKAGLARICHTAKEVAVRFREEGRKQQMPRNP